MTDVVLPLFGTVVSGNAHGPIFATFLWRDIDPLAVGLAFPNQQAWIFSRDLLANGVDGSAGDRLHGDVLVLRMGDDVHISLRSQFGRATVTFPRSMLLDALERTEQIVPRGTETVDWASEMRLLGEAR